MRKLPCYWESWTHGADTQAHTNTHREKLLTCGVLVCICTCVDVGMRTADLCMCGGAGVYVEHSKVRFVCFMLGSHITEFLPPSSSLCCLMTSPVCPLDFGRRARRWCHFRRASPEVTSFLLHNYPLSPSAVRAKAAFLHLWPPRGTVKLLIMEMPGVSVKGKSADV